MMNFSKLAEYFSKLESTSSRNSMVEILAELFKETSAQEIDKVIYLTQGRVAPLFEPVEFQMADKMVVRALASAYGLENDEVTRLYKKSGDLGEVAQELAIKTNETSKANKTRTVEEVFLELRQITQISGEGSVEKKVQILAEIFKENDSLSNRFLARIPVDKMRLGFSDMTVLEGLSWMLDGTKKNKDVMETAYNIRPDLGYIAQQVRAHGLKGIEHVLPKVGTPILVMRAERLTNTQEILEKGNGKVAVEPKLDGLRTQLHIKKVKSQSASWRAKGKSDDEATVNIYSRGMENVTAMYPELVAAAKELDVEEVILDGESIGFDPNTGKFLQFQETVSRKRKHDVDLFSQSVPLKLITFDCLYLNGKSLIDEPYVKRREVLEHLLGKSNKANKTIKTNQTNEGETIILADMKIMDDPGKMEKYFEELVGKGFEGIMAKRLDGVYQAGARGWNWIKFKKSYESKLADTIDCVVMGIDFGEGKRNAFGVGAFLVGVYDSKTDSFKTISKIGTGLTDDEWRQLASLSKDLAVKEKPENYDVNKMMNCDVWFKPKLVGEFKSDELTKSPMHTAGWAMRFPRLEKWREKKPEDTTSIQEIEKLASLSSKTRE